MVEPATVQTEVVDDEYVTAKPDDATPSAEKSPAGFCLVVGLKVIVCEAFEMVKLLVTLVAEL
jgi:hypothetical protein